MTYEEMRMLLGYVARYDGRLSLLTACSQEPAGRWTVVLRDHGFEPIRTEAEVRLRNCPFDAVAKEHITLVCGMNLALAQGLVAGLGADGIGVRLDPMPGACCVAFTPSGKTTAPGHRRDA